MSDTHRLKHTTERKINHETGLLEDVKEKFSDFTNGLKDRLKDRGEDFLQAAREKGIDLWGDVQDRGKDTWKDVKTFIRKNPGEAVAGAFVAGILLYALMSRKKD